MPKGFGAWYEKYFGEPKKRKEEAAQTLSFIDDLLAELGKEPEAEALPVPDLLGGPPMEEGVSAEEAAAFARVGAEPEIPVAETDPRKRQMISLLELMKSAYAGEKPPTEASLDILEDLTSIMTGKGKLTPQEKFAQSMAKYMPESPFMKYKAGEREWKEEFEEEKQEFKTETAQQKYLRQRQLIELRNKNAIQRQQLKDRDDMDAYDKMSVDVQTLIKQHASGKMMTDSAVTWLDDKLTLVAAERQAAAERLEDEYEEELRSAIEKKIMAQDKLMTQLNDVKSDIRLRGDTTPQDEGPQLQQKIDKAKLKLQKLMKQSNPNPKLISDVQKWIAEAEAKLKSQ